MGATGHGLYHHLWAARNHFNQQHALIGSWVTPPMTDAIKIEQGSEENVTINHCCGGGDCGGSGNSDGNSDGIGGGGGGGSGGGGSGGNGGGRESGGDIGGSRGDASNERQ